MKRRVLSVPTLAFCWFILFAPIPEAHAQSGSAARKLEELAKVLQLTPRQRVRLAPILQAEAPKVKAVVADASMPKVQKIEQI
jgi:hypothetical protein